MDVLIVEDETMAQVNLARVLTRHFPDVRIVGTTGSVRDTVLWLRTPGNNADVIFMDVELSDGDCFEIFRQIDVTARVIMTTAYDNYAVRAFEVNSIDYLLKPIELQALKRAVERCRIRGNGIDTDVLLNAIRRPREYKQRFIVRFNDRIVPVQASDIAYFYSEEKNLPRYQRQQPLYHGPVARSPLGRTGSRTVFPDLAQLHHRHAGDRQHREIYGQPTENHGTTEPRIQDGRKSLAC